MVGEGVERLISSALPPSAQELAPEILIAYRARYDAHLTDQSLPYPGVEALLVELQARGYALGVLSNKPHPQTVEVVRRLFPAGTFLEVAGAQPALARKPDPAGALAVAQALGVVVARCAFVGDTWVDIATARAAGMRAIGVGWGFRAPGELLAAGAAAVLDAPEDLLALIEPGGKVPPG